MMWTAFTILKYGFAMGMWYGMDDRLAAHYNCPALGSVPWILVSGLVLLVSISTDQYSVYKVRKVGRE